MTLEGAKFICLDEAGNHGKIVLAKGRKFTMGYYVNCDFVLVDERAKGVHCEIECDAFGRVTIRNFSPDKPILVNGSAVEIKRILLNNSKLSILDKEYLWLFSKRSSNEFEDIPRETASTPLKQIGIPEQPPNSCPDFKLHRDMPKRFTVHNFAYCIHSDEEGNISSESSDENISEGTQVNQNENETQREDSTEDTSQTSKLDKMKNNPKRSITPEPNKEETISTTEQMETPKSNVINCSKDKENKSTQKENKQLLTLCHQSDVVITSFSPRETGVKIEKSFAVIVKPKILITKPPTTPKSVYSTPKGDISGYDESERDLITFHTPSTSKKGAQSTASVKILKNSSMYLIDLTSPNILRPTSPYPKLLLKSSAKKNISQTVNKSSIKSTSNEQLGVKPLPATPTVSEASNSALVTPSSVISVSSSTDASSSAVEVTSDGSNMAITSASATEPKTPSKAQTCAGANTPKRTPHSLMKRALLTSAKKQNITSQTNAQKPTTPRKENINRTPLRSNLAVLRTPSRKNMSETSHFDNTPSTSNLAFSASSPSTSTKYSPRRASINPISAAKVLQTSTPMSCLKNKFTLSNRSTRKTSPLHKVRKSLGGIPLSSHISKARKSIMQPSSTLKITSIKEKSSQQLMSDRLVARARNSLCVTPISVGSRQMLGSAKISNQPTRPTTISKDKTIASAKKPDRKVVLFAKESPLDFNEADNLSRTFIIDSDEEENVDVNKNRQEKPSDATFSPEKDTSKQNLTIEIPVDVEEVGLTKENKSDECEDKEQNNILELQEKVNNKEISATLPSSDKMKAILTEESFAEVINDPDEKNNMVDAMETVDCPKEFSHTETLECFAEAVDKINETTAADEIQNLNKTSNQDNTAGNVETGFGEEAAVEISQIVKETQTEEHNANNAESKEPKLQKKRNAGNIQSGQQDVLTEKTVLIEKTAEEIESCDEQKVDQLKCDEHESCEYKPIVEDITLEGSFIEKELQKVNEERVESKQLQEEMAKSEELEEEESAEIVLKESPDKPEINTSSKVGEIDETLEKLQPDMEAEINIQQTSEISDDIKENEITVSSKTEDVKILNKSNRNDLEPLESNKVDENIEVNVHVHGNNFDKTGEETINKSEAKEKLSETETDTSKICAVNAETFEEKTAKMTQKPDDCETAETEVCSAKMAGADFEDTNKLLEEIEDVLNKSDEIQQKHLNDLEEYSDKPLTEEFETENSEEVDETEEDTNTLNYGKMQEILDSQMIQLNKEDNNVNESSGQELENKKTDNGEAKSEANSVGKNQDLKPSDATVVENKQMLENSDTKGNENDVKNQSNIDNTKVVVTENVVYECGIVDACAENSSLSTHKRAEENTQNITIDIPKQSENKDESEINSNEKTEEAIIDYAEKNQTIYDEGEEYIIIESECSSQEQESDYDILEVRNFKQSKENISEIKKYDDIKMKVKNVTPKSISRRNSQSTNTPKSSAALTFTPKSSSRRASMSAESPITNTPTKSSRRRVSLSYNETPPLTPHRIITRRRSSISTDDESNKPSVSKLQSVKTPWKQFGQSMVIPEEAVDEGADVIVIDDDEETQQDQVHIQEKKCRTSVVLDDAISKTYGIETPRAKTPRRHLEKSMVILEKVDDDISIIVSEEIENNEKEKTSTEEILETQSQIDLKTQNNKHENISLAEKKLELHEEVSQISITNEKEENVAAHNVDSEQQGNIEIIVLEDDSDAEDSITVQGPHTDDKLGKSEYETPQERHESSAQQSEKVDQIMTRDVAPQVADDTVISSEPHEIKELTASSQTPNNSETSPASKAITATNELTTEGSTNVEEKETSSPATEKTPLMLGMGELLKTPTPEVESQSLAGMHEFEGISKDAILTEEESELANQALATELMEASEFNISKNSTSTCDQEAKTVDETLKPEQIILENESEESEQFSVAADSVKTPATPRNKKRVTILVESPKTPAMTFVRELLKTPKREMPTPKLSGIRDMMQTPKDKTENEQEEIEKLSMVAQLVRTPQTCKNPQNLIEETPSSSTKTPAISKDKKRVTILVESPKTPAMTFVRDFLKNPKREMSTPKLTGVRELLQTPNENTEIEQEEIEKLTMVAGLVKTPQQSSKNNQHSAEEMPSSSMKNVNLKGVKELLKTPKTCATPRFRGIRELMQTPKVTSSPITSGMKELLESPNPQEAVELQPSESSEILSGPEQLAEEIASVEISENVVILKGVKELLQTPKCCSTPRLKGIKELMKTPKTSSTPLLVGIKELMDTPAQQKDPNELDKFLRTPTAKNIMIPSMPSSTIIEKSGDSIEVSTEYDLNATNLDESTNLEELFKAPDTSHFAERITESYYGDVVIDKPTSTTRNESLQDIINKTAENAFDKLVGQDTQVQTPVHKRYERKTFTLQTPHNTKSPFTGADILSDLPRTDVEEWIETLEQAEPPIILECYDSDEEQDAVKQDINESIKYAEEESRVSYSMSEQDINESIIPETCTKVYLTDNTYKTKPIEAKDPLSNTDKKLKEKLTCSLGTSLDPEISGINLLDQTLESLPDVPSSMLEEPLLVDEPSMFEEALVVSDNESEAENSLNYRVSHEVLQDEGNDLSEPLLVSDSEDLNQSQETEKNKTIRIENALDQTSDLSINDQEKSMLEKHANVGDLSTEDPLGNENHEISAEVIKEDKTLTELDISQSEEECEEKSLSNPENTFPPEDCIINDLFANENIESEFFEAAEQQGNAVILEDFSTSKMTELLETASSSQNDPQIEHTDTDAKEVAIEQTKVISVESGDIFVDASVTEICQETTPSNEEHVEERKGKVSSEETDKEKINDECQNIFMDNSNIHEAFANEESEVAVCEVVKADRNISIIAEKATTVISEEAAVEAEHSDGKLEEALDQSSFVSKEIEENMETTMEIESQPIATSAIGVVDALDNNTVEYETIESLVIEQESASEKQTDTQSSKSTIKEEVSIKNTETNEEVLQHSSNVSEEIQDESLAGSTESLVDTAIDNEIITIPECELPVAEENAAGLVDDDDDVKDLSAISNDDKNNEILESPNTSRSQKSEDTNSENKVVSKKEALEDKLSLSSDTQDSLNVPAQNLQPVHTSQKAESGRGGAENLLTRDIEEVEIYLEKSVFSESINEEILLDDSASDETPSTTNVKCDFEIKITDSSHHTKDTKSEIDHSATKEILTDDRAREISGAKSTEKNASEINSQVEEDLRKAEATPALLHQKVNTEDMQNNSADAQDKNVIEVSQEVTKVLVETSEIKETKRNKPSLSLRKRTASKDIQESAMKEETSASSSRKINRKTTTQKLVNVKEEMKDNRQISEDTTAAAVKESGKPKMKRTTSDSSQGSVNDDDNYVRICRGGLLRNIQKTTVEETVAEQGEECEEHIQQADKVCEEPQANEARTEPAILSEEISASEQLPTSKQNIPKETDTQSNQNTAPQSDKIIEKQQSTRKDSEALHKQDEEITNHNQLLVNEVQRDETMKLDATQKQIASGDVPAPGITKVETVEHATSTTMKAKTLSSDSTEIIESQREDNQFVTGTEIAKQVISSTKTIIPDSELETIEDASDHQFISIVSKETSLAALVEQGTSEVSKELSELISKTSEDKIGKPDNVALPAALESGLLKQNADEEQILEKPPNDTDKLNPEVTNVIEINSEDEDVTAANENLPIVEEVTVFTENTKRQAANKRGGRRKPTISESSHDSDEKLTSKTARRRIQKSAVEEVVIEENEGDKLEAASAKNEDISNQTKILHGVNEIDSKNDETTEVESSTLVVQQQEQKRTRRKASASESSQGSVLDDDTIRTRRGRCKTQKTPVEDIVIDEEDNAENTVEVVAVVECNEIADTLSKLNETESKMKSDADDTDNSPAVESKECIIKHDTNLEHEIHQPQSTECQIQEISTNDLKDEESKTTTSRRGRNKRNLPETVFEAPTSSRKTRRKVQVPKAEPSKAKTKSETQTQPEDVKVNENSIETMETEKQTIQKIDEVIKEKIPEIDEQIHQESPALEQTEKETNEAEMSTKPIGKRARLHKLELETEIEKDKKLEHKVETIATYTTRRGGRHNIESSGTPVAATAAVKSRSTNRNRKTPVELSTGIHEPSKLVKGDPDDPEIRKEESSSLELKTVAEASQRDAVVIEQLAEPAETIAERTDDSKPPNEIKLPTDEKVTECVESTSSISEVLVVVEEKSTKRRPRGQKTKTEESHKEEIELNPANIASPKTDNENIPRHDEDIEPQKSIKRRAAVKHDQPELSTMSRRRRQAAKYDDDNAKTHSENIVATKESIEEASLCEEKISEVNLQAEPSSDHQITSSPEQNREVKTRKARRRAIVEDTHPEDYATPPASKRKAVVKHTKEDHTPSGPSIKRRIGRKNQIEEKHDAEELLVAHTDTVEITSEHHPIVEVLQEREKEDNLGIMHIEEVENKNNVGSSTNEKEECKQTATSETTSRRRNAGKKKPDYKEDDDKQMSKKAKKDEDTTNAGNIEDLNVGTGKKQEPGENQAFQQPPTGTKKGRGRKKKIDQPEESEQSAVTNLPQTKDNKSPKRKQLHSDIHDQISKEDVPTDEKTTEPPAANINIPNDIMEHQTPQAIAPTAKIVRKAFEHITAESGEVEDTPSRRGRDVPQRKAATAYHNYDETSDSEILTKTKKKTDSPRKSLESVKKSPSATTTSASNLSASPSLSSTGLITTARGRTRKPTAKVQQFLEEERAKAETPKRRALLAAAAAVSVCGATTPQRTPARRGRKPSTIETEVDIGTPQTSKVRGKAKPSVMLSKEEDTGAASEITSVVEEKETDLQTTPPPTNTVKGRRGRKAKITEERHHSSEEPPAKKSPVDLESEKQDSTPSVEVATPPTRVAGKRNAAAAAKARIEEDALAAAATEPPKRPRAKKATPKVSTPAVATTDTDAPNSEAEEKELGDKTASQKRDHRLASASTVEGIEDLQDEAEMGIMDKPANKRTRKLAASTTTDSSALPVKRPRKPKNVDIDDQETPQQSKTSRGRGRGRKNVHFDEHQEADAATSSSQQNPTDIEPVAVVTSEPVKKSTRTRRK